MLVDEAEITGERGSPLDQLITVVEEPLPQHLVPVFDAPPPPPPATS
ncbi:hypothetical protein [Streptomyces tendae]